MLVPLRRPEEVVFIFVPGKRIDGDAARESGFCCPAPQKFAVTINLQPAS
jgi:hypothetical protein